MDTCLERSILHEVDSRHWVENWSHCIVHGDVCIGQGAVGYDPRRAGRVFPIRFCDPCVIRVAFDAGRIVRRGIRQIKARACVARICWNRSYGVEFHGGRVPSLA